MLQVILVCLEYTRIFYKFYNKISSDLIDKKTYWTRTGLRTTMRLEMRQVSWSWSEIVIMKPGMALLSVWSFRLLFQCCSVISNDGLWNALLKCNVIQVCHFLLTAGCISIITTDNYIAAIWARFCVKCFICVNSFNPYNIPIPKVLLVRPVTTKKTKEERS